MAPPLATPQDDPKKLLFTMMATKNSFMSDQDYENDIKALLNASPNMTIKDISALPSGASVEDTMIRAIRQQVSTQGTLKEIMIFGHGESERQYIGADNGLSTIKNLYLEKKASSTGTRDDAAVNIHTDSFLKKLNGLQKELGVKITDRIVFMGCNVLTNLPSKQVAFYRETAKNLGAEIVGPTNTIGITGGGPIGKILHTKPTVTARFEKFTPQGNVEPDMLSSHSDSFGERIVGTITDGISGIFGASAAWAQCHENKTQTEGATCQQEKENSSLTRAISEKANSLFHWSEAGLDLISAPSTSPAHRDSAKKIPPQK